MIRRIFIFLGLFLVFTGMFIIFHIFLNKENSNYWYSREYTLIRKNESHHENKGNDISDYYITVKYDDDSEFLWTEQVCGTKYFSLNEGQRYTERTLIMSSRESHLLTIGIFIIIIIGILIFVFNLSNEMM